MMVELIVAAAELVVAVPVAPHGAGGHLGSQGRQSRSRLYARAALCRRQPEPQAAGISLDTEPPSAYRRYIRRAVRAECILVTKEKGEEEEG